MEDHFWLLVPAGHCSLEGFRIQCSGPLEGNHIINKSKARGNDAVRAILASCPPEVMSDVCSAHNVARWADTDEARRIMLLQNVYRFGWARMQRFFESLPWKASGGEFRLEAML